jgi:hypothetical protein
MSVGNNASNPRFEMDVSFEPLMMFVVNVISELPYNTGKSYPVALSTLSAHSPRGVLGVVPGTWHGIRRSMEKEMIRRSTRCPAT